MINVEQALEKILSNVDVLKGEPRPILDCLGRVLAEDIYADINVPSLDNSAFDGYAVQSGDTSGTSQQSPRLLTVIDTVSAGSISRREVKPGTAIRIMTGAPVPRGADCVVMFEDTDEVQRKEAAGQTATAEIGILREAEAGSNIRQAGESVAQGSLILTKGTVIRPSEIGVLASLGRGTVMVIRRPLIAILATGDEVVELNQSLPEGKIYNSNTYSLAAQVLLYGGIPRILGIARDDEESVVAGLQKGLDADMLVTIGGISMGDYDVVKDVLVKQGEVVFWKVRMKPGKPLAFGVIKGINQEGVARDIPHLGLAGNPVSCMVSSELFARPAIFKMMGKKNLSKPTIEAVMENRVVNKGGRRVFARVIVDRREGQYSARLTGEQGSGILTSMTLANGLAIVPEDKAEVKVGDKLQVMMLDWNEEI